MEANNGLKVFVRKDEVLTLSDEQIRIRLEKVITRQEGETSYDDFWKVLPLIVMTAAVDAVPIAVTWFFILLAVFYAVSALIMFVKLRSYAAKQETR